jgi:hypothetical protein
VRRWTSWTEADIARAFGANKKGAANAFWLTNRLRKKQNSRKRSQKTRQVAEGRTPKKVAWRRYRPLLRQSVMAREGVAV